VSANRKEVDEKKQRYRVETEQEARIAPPPSDEEKRDSVDHKCLSTPGLFVRVFKPDSKARIRRQWVHRYDEFRPDGAGGVKKHNKKPAFGLVQALDSSEKAMSLEEAQRYVLNARAATTASKADGRGGSPRLTIATAMKYYDADNPTHRDTTRIKDKKVIERYFKQFEDRYLDELNYAFWLNFQNSFLNGKVQVGEKTDADGKVVPVYRRPLSTATVSNIMTAAIRLYQLAATFEGLKDVKEGYNPPRDVKKKLPVIHKKSRRIPLDQLGLALRASRQLCPPWWADLFECYLLTGLRRSLMVDMRFDQIDFKRKLYMIDPHRPGTKRRGSRLPADAPFIALPLSDRVLEILGARQEFATDKKAWVWYTSRAQRGIRTKTEARLADPRSSWRYISESIGDLHFGPQDLRRTYASICGATVPDLFAFSLLMLHSPVTVAKEVGIPGISIEYMNTDEAQGKMRAAAEQVSAYVRKLEQDVDRKMKIEERALPQEIEAALNAESKEEADASGEVEDEEADEAA
jgi:integrase